MQCVSVVDPYWLAEQVEGAEWVLESDMAAGPHVLPSEGELVPRKDSTEATKLVYVQTTGLSDPWTQARRC
eukprot:172567-Hanusia_phi.AAC.2